MKKHKVGIPVRKGLLMSWILAPGFYKVPIEAIREILSWNIIYKSNYSYSFYSKEKGWNLTHHETIRISDHWNFESRGVVHCKSEPPLGQDTWAKGIYDAKTEKFKIVEYYKPNGDRSHFISEMNKIRNSELGEHLNSIAPEIEKGKRIARLVDEGKVTFEMDGDKFQVKKVKKEYVVIGEEKIKVEHFRGKLMHGTEILELPNTRMK